MTTEKQRHANQRNATRSTGPKTRTGKEAARLNALKHGLLSQFVVLPGTGESQDEYEKLLAGLRTDLHPTGVLQESLVELIAANLWTLRRRYRAEAGALNQASQSARRQSHEDIQRALRDAVEAIYAPPHPATSAELVNLSEAEQALAAFERSHGPRVSAAATLLTFSAGVEWVVDFLGHVRDALASDGEVALADWQILIAIGLHRSTGLQRWALAQRNRTEAAVRKASSSSTVRLREDEVSTLDTRLQHVVAVLSQILVEMRQEDEELVTQTVESGTVPESAVLDRILRYEKTATNNIYRALHELRDQKKAASEELATPKVDILLTPKET